MTEKKCSKCGVEKEASTKEFYKNKQNADGLRYVCKICGRSDTRRWYCLNPKKKAEYRTKNKEKIKAAGVKYRKANSGKMKAHNTEYYKANPEKLIAVRAKWRKNNPEKIKEMHAKWRKDNPERVKVYACGWRKENPEMGKANKHKRRARKRAAGGIFTASDIKKMLKQQKAKCIVCQTDITNSYHIDHIMPLVLGGSNNISNIQLLCQHCNLSKGAKHPIDFMQGNGFLL